MKRYKDKLKESKQPLTEAGKAYKLLNQEGYFQKVYPHIKAMNTIIGFDIDLARSICVHILQDVNDHDMSAKLDMLFSRDM
jgi:ABC-type amino acid transport substrate-binding protein